MNSGTPRYDLLSRVIPENCLKITVDGCYKLLFILYDSVILDDIGSTVLLLKSVCNLYMSLMVMIRSGCAKVYAVSFMLIKEPKKPQSSLSQTGASLKSVCGS